MGIQSCVVMEDEHTVLCGVDDDFVQSYLEVEDDHTVLCGEKDKYPVLCQAEDENTVL